MSTLRSFPQFCERHPAFTVRRLRWIDFRARSDDGDPSFVKFRPAFCRVGRRVFVDEPRFLAIAKGDA